MRLLERAKIGMFMLRTVSSPLMLTASPSLQLTKKSNSSLCIEIGENKMPALLKEMYNHESLHELALLIQSAYQPFQVDSFLKSTMDETWDKLELKARMRQVSTKMGKYLPVDYKVAIGILDKIVAKVERGLFGLIFPDFVEVYGQDETDWTLSMEALEKYTVYSSAEFAVRPFIIHHEARMMAQMYAWSNHENEHVRRLASEGCRPQLPWGQSLPKYKKDPTPILPILEQLKADPSLYVRRSVANNLNDIAKTHPALVTEIAQKWYGENEETNWLIKHGCRTLLKKGNRHVLAIFGYDDGATIEIADFSLNATTVSIGNALTFSFKIEVAKPTKIRLEYGIDFVKANGKTNRKIFQISERMLKENEQQSYTKTHTFADLSTRKHYPGLHGITLIVNGVERGKVDFNLKA